jgi:lipid II:glycine glycyltransferase (peptidoglycan interpeptide bridge formation enzyme)
MITADSTDCDFQLIRSDHQDWDAYVRQHPKGSVFHTSAMIRAVSATSGLDSHAYAALDDDGKIVAMLVSCHVKTLSRFAAMSSRAVQFAEPLCDRSEIGVVALTQLISMHAKHMCSRSLLSEVRAICEPCYEKIALTRSGYEHRDYINYVVDTSKDTETLWSNVNKRMRQKIRGTIRKGVVVRDDTSIEGVERLYRLLRASYGRAKIPLRGQDLFENVLEYLPPEWVRLRTAFQDEMPIASIISLVYGDRVFSWYGGTLRLNGLSPFACIVWDDIAWASENGYAHYDFGGAGWPHENYGPREFKARFGGEQVRYGRYTLTYSDLRLRVAEFAYRASRRLGAWS